MIYKNKVILYHLILNFLFDKYSIICYIINGKNKFKIFLKKVVFGC